MDLKGKGIKRGMSNFLIPCTFRNKARSHLHPSSIDSGVNYNHPSLEQGLGPGRKIVGGKDYVGVEDISKPFTLPTMIPWIVMATEPMW